MMNSGADPFMTGGTSRPFSTRQQGAPPGYMLDPFSTGGEQMTVSPQMAQPQEPPSGLMQSQRLSVADVQSRAQPQEAPLAGSAPAAQIVSYWYVGENNWNHCNQQMLDHYRQIQMEFSGTFSDEQRLVQETRVEEFEDELYKQTGGRLGHKYSPKTRTAHVKDIFQDDKFPPSDRSWYRGGEIPDYSLLPKPAQWRRLQEFVMDVPFPTASPANGGFLPRAGRVHQGCLEDFYLVAGMQTVGMKPWLINQIIDMNCSNPSLGVFTVRFYKHGQWHHVVVDGALPFDKFLNPMCSRSEFWPSFAWPAIIEKAYAKLHGSWEGLGGGGHVEEVLTDLTGGCSSRFSTTDVAQDRLWQYLNELQRICLFGCNTNDKECQKRRIPMEKHHAASIFRVAKYQDVPYVCVCLAAPTYAVSRMPACEVPMPEGYGVHDGFVWLRIDDFVMLFDTIYECRLVNSELGPPAMSGVPYTPGWVSGQPYFEEIYAFQGDVYSETAPSFMMEILDTPNEITMEVTQTDLRYGDAQSEDLGRPMQAPLLLRFFQCSPDVTDRGGGEVYMVHLSAWGHTRDASLTVKVMKPGKYLAMVSVPAKYVCHRMIYRSYSTRPLVAKPITQHRSWIAVNPAHPLDAIPYSLCGFQRVDTSSERLPQMFDEADGRGKPMANSQLSGGAGSGFGFSFGFGFGAPGMPGMPGFDGFGLGGRGGSSANNPEGLKVVGRFGGEGAVASVNAAESQDMQCALM